MNSLTQAYINTNFEGTTSYIDFHSVIRKKKKNFHDNIRQRTTRAILVDM